MRRLATLAAAALATGLAAATAEAQPHETCEPPNDCVTPVVQIVYEELRPLLDIWP